MTDKQTLENNNYVVVNTDKPMSEVYADLSISPYFMNASITESFAKDIIPDVHLIDITNSLKESISEVVAGNTSSMEAMLLGQAQALQAMFVSLGRQAKAQTNLKHSTAFMTMALKAQSQSRATIQALTELKYPRQATFVKQANISHGHQQVNNGSFDTNMHERAHVKEKTIQSNELLEKQNGEWLDSGTKSATSRTNQAMATVESLDRRKVN
jgi:hypothetical protein